MDYSHYSINTKLITDKVPVDGLDLRILAEIVNDEWNSLIEIDESLLNERFGSGEIFVAAYAHANRSDQEYLKERGIQVSRHDIIPIGILETISLDFEGYEKMPETYMELTNDGTWEARSGDSIVLVDFSAISTRKKDLNDLKDSMMKMFTAVVNEGIERDAKKILGYLPDGDYFNKVPLIKMAYDTEVVKKDARPGYENPDARIMDYSFIFGGR